MNPKIDETLVADLYAAKLSPVIVPIGSYHAFGEGVDKDFVLLFRDPPRIPGSPLPAIIRATSVWEDAIETLKDHGYVVTSVDLGDEGSGGGNDEFTAMRKGDINLMVTGTADFAYKSAAAFNVVRALNLRDKKERIWVHQIVVDGVSLDDLYRG